jgi:hypothetical protein
MNLKKSKIFLPFKGFIYTNLNFILAFILLIFISIGIQNERIPVYNGLGWDGFDLSKMLKNLDNSSELGVTSYRAQRALPFVFIWTLSKIFNFELTSSSIVKSFLTLNSFLILSSFYYWHKVTNYFNFNKKIKIISFIGIFLNYAVLKMALYYPVLTDTCAFTLGLASYYYYIKNNYLKLFLTIFIGAFTFPTLVYIGIFFYLWPYKMPIPFNDKIKNINKFIVFFILTLYGIAIILLFKFHFYKLNINVKFNTVNPVNLSLLPLSVIISCSYLFLIASSLLKINILKFLLSSVSFIKLTFIVISLFLLKVLISNLSNGNPGFGIRDFGENILVQSITNPFAYWVSHIMYYGPIFSLILFRFKYYIKTIESEGIGIFVYSLFFLFLLMGSESRQFINAFPILYIILFLSIKDKNVSWKFVMFTGLASLIYSRFWFTINKEEFKGEDFLTLPWQNYFMSQGPWMSSYSYFGFLTIIFFTLIIFYCILKKEIKSILIK